MSRLSALVSATLIAVALPAAARAGEYGFHRGASAWESPRRVAAYAPRPAVRHFRRVAVRAGLPPGLAVAGFGILGHDAIDVPVAASGRRYEAVRAYPLARPSNERYGFAWAPAAVARAYTPEPDPDFYGEPY